MTRTEIKAAIAKMKILKYGKVTIFEDARVIRFIRFFPTGSNQEIKKCLVYDKNGYIMMCFVSTYINAASLRKELPDRISVIEDSFYHTRRKDFDYFEETSLI